MYNESGYFDSSANAKPMLHLWSLAIEEQFYLLWPLILILVARFGKGYLIPSVILAIASFYFSLVMTTNNPSAAFYWPITRFWELLIGSVLAMSVLRRSNWTSKYINLGSFLGVFFLATGFMFTTESKAFPGWWAVLPTIGTMLIIWAGPMAWVNRSVLSMKVMVYVGRISYPLYLWHWPILSIAFILEGGYPSRLSRVVLVVLAIVLASLTHELIEKRMRKCNSKLSAKLLLTMSVVLVASLAMPKILDLAPRNVFGVVRAAPLFLEPIVSTEDVNRGFCRDIGGDIGEHRANLCTLNINLDAKKSIVVWGDSHAAGWSIALEQIAEFGDIGVSVLSTPGCPPLVGVRQTPGVSEKSSCDHLGYTDSVLEEIVGLKPSMIILAARWDLYFRGFTRNGKIEKTSHFLTTSPSGRADEISTMAAIESQLPETIDRIVSAGIAPLVIVNPPVLLGNVLNLRKDVSVSKKQHDEYQLPIYKTLRNLDVPYFDTSVIMCETDSCKLYDSSGHPLYTDDNHLSVAGSLYLAPYLERLINSNLALE